MAVSTQFCSDKFNQSIKIALHWLLKSLNKLFSPNSLSYYSLLWDLVQILKAEKIHKEI